MLEVTQLAAHVYAGYLFGEAKILNTTYDRLAEAMNSVCGLFHRTVASVNPDKKKPCGIWHGEPAEP